MMIDNEVFKEGLVGVFVVKLRVSYVDGIDGILEYWGICIEELVKFSSFIEVVYLFIWGKLFI